MGETTAAADRWDVFISYASRDREAAVALHDALATRGLTAFIDVHGLRGGDDWHDLLPGVMRSSAVIVALISRATPDAHWQNSEIIEAISLLRTEGKRLIPVVIEDGATRILGTQQLHALDATGASGMPGASADIAEIVADPASIPIPEEYQIFGPRIRHLPEPVIGHERLLAQVMPGASWSQSSVRVLVGLGGVGKTTLALQAAHKAREECDVVWWVRSETEAGLIHDLASLADRLGLDRETADESAEAAVRWLERTRRRWYLVFDDAADVHQLGAWLPRMSEGHILITTRDRAFARLGPVIEVESLSQADASRYLAERVEGSNPDAVRGTALARVASRLGGLPLALEQAASYVTRSPHRTFEDFLERLDDVTADPYPASTRPLGYPETALSTWRVSIDAAEEEAGGAESMLSVLAHLDPDRIPPRYAEAEAVCSFLPGDRRQARDALAALHGYSLVGVEPQSIRVHRVVQDASRRSSGSGAAAAALELLDAEIPADLEDPQHWAGLAELVPHVLALNRHVGSHRSELAGGLWSLLDDVALYLIASGDLTVGTLAAELALRIARSQLDTDTDEYRLAIERLASAYELGRSTTEALQLYSEALELTVASRGVDSPESIRRLADVAAAHVHDGQIEDGLQLYADAHAKAVEVLGAAHPSTRGIAHNYAAALEEAGRLDEAIARYWELLDLDAAEGDMPTSEEATLRQSLARALLARGETSRGLAMLETAVTMSEQQLGPNHPLSLICGSDLAVAYEDVGRLSRAIELFGDLERRAQESLDEAHPVRVVIRNNLANAYEAAGRYPEAIRLLRRLLRDEGQRLGTDHRDVLSTRSNLAMALLASGKADVALRLFQQVSEARRMVLGPEHPETLLAHGNLAGAYEAVGRLDEAMNRYETVLAESQRILGPAHPHTVGFAADLAYVYESVGRTSEAIDLLEDVIASTQSDLGELDPTVMTYRNNLACAYETSGQIAEAEAMHREVLRDRRDVLGEDHPDTIDSLSNLAQVVDRAGEASEAARLYEAVVSRANLLFGPDHPKTLTALHNQATGYAGAGEYERAIPLFRQVLSTREAHFAPTHPHALMTRSNLAAALIDSDQVAEASALVEEGLGIVEGALSPGHEAVRRLEMLAEVIDELTA